MVELEVEVPMKLLPKMLAAMLFLSPVSVLAAESELVQRETQMFVANGQAVLVHFQYYSPGVALSRRYPEGCKVTYQFPQYAPIEVVLSAKGPPITVDKSITIGCKLDVPKQSVRVTVAEK